jgi:hypothetical protein
MCPTFTIPSQKNHDSRTLACYTVGNSIAKVGLEVKRQDMTKKPCRYVSYVLRCWQESSVHRGRETRVWRFSLQNPRTNQRRGFATLEALLVSLQEGLSDEKDNPA